MIRREGGRQGRKEGRREGDGGREGKEREGKEGWREYRAFGRKSGKGEKEKKLLEGRERNIGILFLEYCISHNLSYLDFDPNTSTLSTATDDR